MSNFGKYFVRYVGGSFLYGGFRSMAYSSKLRNKEGNRPPFGTQLAGILIGAFMSPVLLPIYIIDDMNFADQKYVMKKEFEEKFFPYSDYKIHVHPKKKE